MAIPQKLLKEFVGNVENLLKIDALHVSGQKYRVNVWTQITFDDTIIADNKIHSSYFVSFDGKTITNKTQGA